MEGVSRSLVLSGAKMVSVVHFGRAGIFLFVVVFGFCILFLSRCLKLCHLLKKNIY